ncbi:MAG: MarR family transcriptional regulator [Candidatus Caenarcaniphilales bacterium]|nr:MarR family transcriptional regulator [Candidatus Caenarcaniphilales bacterium]
MKEKKIIETRSKQEEDLGFKILGYLRRITRAINLNSKRLATENNLTSPQTFSLITIYHMGPLTLAEVASKVHLSPSTMVGIIDRLEVKNLVIRERSKDDKRQVRIRITEEGKKIAKKSPLPLQEELLESLSKLPEIQQKNLSKALKLLASILDTNHSSDKSLSADESCED